MIASTYEQKEQPKTVKHLRTSVSFSDDVTTHEIPKLDDGEAAEVYYSRSDYKKFQKAQRVREDRKTVKQIRRRIEDTFATLEALELSGMQTPPADGLLLVKPPSMPVRQASSERPSMPVRQASTSTIIVTDFSPTPVALAEPPSMHVMQASRSSNGFTDIRTTANATRPVRQLSRKNVFEISIALAVFPDAPASRLDSGALAA
jgi:hypothetical protein